MSQVVLMIHSWHVEELVGILRDGVSFACGAMVWMVGFLVYCGYSISPNCDVSSRARNVKSPWQYEKAQFI